MHSYSIKAKQAFVLAQITDSHLFADRQGLHHGHNVYDNLLKVLNDIASNPAIDCMVFTGDLTQDHSEQSYQNFVNAVLKSHVKIPIYYVAGNHDEPAFLKKHLSKAPFSSETTIDLCGWQIQLVASKSDTPAGFVSDLAFKKLKASIVPSKHQLLMMHHHPIDVGYFIDKHGLQNKAQFWQQIATFSNIKAIACGHVHGAMQLTQLPENKSSIHNQGEINSNDKVTLYTCPATSIQFDPSIECVSALNKGPGYQLFHLDVDGGLHQEVMYL